MIEIIFSAQDVVDVIKPIDVSDVDKVVVVASSNIEKLEKFLKRKNVDYEVLSVREDFEDIAEKIASFVARHRDEEILVNLINVPPLFVVATVSALLLTNTDAELVFSQSVRVKDIMPVKIDEEHKEILKVLGEDDDSLTNISKKVGLPITTTWRRLNELAEEEVITREYTLTRKGKILKATLI